MSFNSNKIKHGRRIQQTDRHIRRQINHYRILWPTDSAEYRSHPQVIEPHRLAKRNSFNCGDPTCSYCMNPRKAFKERTFQEKKFYSQPLDFNYEYI